MSTSPLMERLRADNRRLLMDRSVSGRMGTTVPLLDVPETPLPEDELLRSELNLPEVSESELVRYFSQLMTDMLGSSYGWLS